MFRLSSGNRSDIELEAEEDAKKAFALLEMRSRIMEKDIERGLERQGGTVVVDDIVLTPYNQAAMRVRDAVIVSKAWRHGASPRDVLTASLLTRRHERTYSIRRPIHQDKRHDMLTMSNSFEKPWAVRGTNYTMEEVRWVDEVDFMQLRCPSLCPRHMRGFEMFTIGDCQSILLKLTNERCSQLREELNSATTRQIEAEELLKVEESEGNGIDIMTEAEMTYLSAMEEVKTISKKLVVAEKAFKLVRERIEKLVARYEALLVKMDATSAMNASSFEESDYTDDYDSHYDSEENDREKEILARRAQRAELRAEVAAREAMLARQEAVKIREEKQRELEVLQQRLAELQSEAISVADRDRSAKIANAIAAAQNSASRTTAKSSDRQGRSVPIVDKSKIDGVKEKFRERMAERIRKGPPSRRGQENTALVSSSGFDTSIGRRKPHPRHRLSGEEMFQHLDFYERSLKAVDVEHY
eukprot:CAMPEP_0118714996 /NCGR_PEP_ID=MMETSP0800-20121206/26581_1 /TAXON_ID=210618 ORGANISM="Striatella unipunctata, Strain CCMP2910" /NCGR_SAMPLE_ID=MMETSP0800 /ASSEMBLY_ACC=CAM_ASM_000638 /LENGTH=470 /DNA_ID=CAMNT_0006621019 /DNA_START=240 /DNA_END=1652 /DNA_ORIENTATION=-